MDPLQHLHIVSDFLTDLIFDYSIYFTLAHIILSLLSVKSEWIKSNSKQNPLATFSCSLICCNAGSIITAVLTSNKTVLECILFASNENNIFLYFCLLWWLIFYCPFDYFTELLINENRISRFCKFLYVFKELLRCKKIKTGVQLGYELYGKGKHFNNHFLYSIILGVIASNGTSFIINIGKFISNRPFSGKILLSTSSLCKFSILFSISYSCFPKYANYTLLFQFITMSIYKLKLLEIESYVEATFHICGSKLTSVMNEGEMEKGANNLNVNSKKTE